MHSHTHKVGEEEGDFEYFPEDTIRSTQSENKTIAIMLWEEEKKEEEIQINLLLAEIIVQFYLIFHCS